MKKYIKILLVLIIGLTISITSVGAKSYIKDFSNNCEIFFPFFTVSNFPFFSMVFINFLYIMSNTAGTDIIAVI